MENPLDAPDVAVSATPPAPRRSRWVGWLAALNIAWVTLAVVALTSQTWWIILGMIALPQSLVLVHQPLVLWTLVAVVVGIVALLVWRRGKPGERGWLVWKYGTVALTISLVSGPLLLLVLSVFGRVL